MYKNVWKQVNNIIYKKVHFEVSNLRIHKFEKIVEKKFYST